MSDDDLALLIRDYFESGAAKEDEMYQILCEDAIIHTDDHPVCSDDSCPCQFKVIGKSFSTVEIEDSQKCYRSHVFLQGDGKWRCLRCDRYRCVHAKWVAAQSIELPKLPELSASDIDDILTY